MIEFGPDLSHWQSRVDFAALKDSGAQGVILKATQGTSWVDNTFARRVGLAMSVGLKVGAYHFCDASDPQAQAQHFLNVAQMAAPLLALDIEANGMGNTVSITQAAEIAARVAMATARAPLIYINRYGPGGNGLGLPNAVLARCPLWIPHYTSAAQPTLPAGWSSWIFWQYTDSPGDQNRFNGTADELGTLF